MTHWDVVEFAGACELSKNNQEDDCARNPGVSLICVDDLISEESNEEGQAGNHCELLDVFCPKRTNILTNDTSKSRHIRVYSVE